MVYDGKLEALDLEDGWAAELGHYWFDLISMHGLHMRLRTTK